MVEIPYKKQDLEREKERLADGNGGNGNVKGGKGIEAAVGETAGGNWGRGNAGSSEDGRSGVGFSRERQVERGEGGKAVVEKEEVIWAAETLNP